MNELEIKPNSVLETLPPVTAWRLGAETGITYEEIIPNGNWQKYAPTFERQRNDLFDSNCCVTYAGHNVLETILNMKIAKNELNDFALNFLIDNGYLDGNGKVNFNDAFSAKLNGTTINGNHLQAFWDGVRKYGVIPQKDWIDIKDLSKWEDLMQEIPQHLLDKGQEFLKYFKINFEWVLLGNCDPRIIQKQLKQSPLHVATPVCSPWNTNKLIKYCGDKRLAHATTTIGWDVGYLQLDHYKPEIKKLDKDYYVPYAIKATINNYGEPIEETFKYFFTRNLRFGERGEDVVAMQKVLRLHGFLKVNPTGYFGEHTKNALIAFQEKYAEDILAPYGLVYGTGNFGDLTRKKFNQLHS